MKKAKSSNILTSLPLSEAFLAIVGKVNYSHELARHLGTSQPAALKLIRRLEHEGLIFSKVKGRKLIYYPNWKNVASFWCEFVIQENKPKSWARKYWMGASNIGATIENKIGSPNWYDYVKRMSDQNIEILKRMKNDEAFAKFTQIYFESVMWWNVFLTFTDLFGWFYSDHVMPHLFKELHDYKSREKKSITDPIGTEIIEAKAPFFINLQTNMFTDQLGIFIAGDIEEKIKESKLAPKIRQKIPIYSYMGTIFVRGNVVVKKQKIKRSKYADNKPPGTRNIGTIKV